MPEASPAAVAPTPSTHPNAPQNGAAPPAAGAATQTQPPAAGATDITAKYKALEETHQKKVREQIVERRKWEADRKTLAEKAAKADALEKREARAKLNPSAYLKDLYGDDWHTIVNEAKLNGVAPAALIEQEMQKLRDEMAEKDRARAEEGEKSQAAAQAQAEESARKSIFAECAQFYRAKASDYPIFEMVKGGEPAVARMLSARIESEFHATGKILSTSEVADLLESEVLEWASAAGKHEKYKSKLQPSGTSTTVAKPSQQQGQPKQPAARVSLTNDITGSTSPTTPPASEKERRARSIAAYEAHQRKG